MNDIKLGPYREEPVPIRMSAFEAFKRMYPFCKSMFLLESLGEDLPAGRQGKYNRFSYVGFDPLSHIVAKNGELFIDGRLVKTDNPYKYLSIHFSKLSKKQKKEGFTGGLVGYISYEGTRYFEPAFSPLPSGSFPDFEFGLFGDGLMFDKKTGMITYFHYGTNRMQKILSLLHGSGELGMFEYKTLSRSKSKDEHRAMVEEAIRRIQAGDIFQVVLSNRTHYKIAGDIRRLYAVLRQVNPSPYMFFFKFKDRSVIAASPELLIRVKGREVEHFGTLAGTIRRGETEALDETLAKTLLRDVKERAEHMMLVDLARNDVGKLCEFGSVRVDKLYSVKKFSHVQHIYSEIRGRLRKDQNAFSALAACFPAGTISGAPKIEAMKIINKLEGQPRGPYGGVGGYISFSGDSMFALTIRSIFSVGDAAYTQTGSGIVLDSKADLEYQEIANKQRAMEEALFLAGDRKKLRY